jgi:hypothetical protein
MDENLQWQLDFKTSLQLLNYFIENNDYTEIDFKKNCIDLFDDNSGLLVQFKFPLVLNLSETIIKDKNLFNTYHSEDSFYYVMLIQTGFAALGVFQNETPLKHKVIRKYMTRQKQGRSQLNYLKTKGKSRAGSRVRLTNAVSFFEEINERMNLWQKEYAQYPVLYSCTPMLWGMLFQSRIKPVFNKKDARLKKIPLDLRKPNIEVMQQAARYSLKGYLNFSPNCPAKRLTDILNIVHSPIYSVVSPINSKL